MSRSDEPQKSSWTGVVAVDCQCSSFLPERIFVLPQGERRGEQATGYRHGTLFHMHTGRGKPRHPARPAGPTEIRDYTRPGQSWELKYAFRFLRPMVSSSATIT